MLRVLPPMFNPVNNLICCKTDFMWAVKRKKNRYLTRFAATLKNKLHVFCCPFFRTFRHVDLPKFVEWEVSLRS